MGEKREGFKNSVMYDKGLTGFNKGKLATTRESFQLTPETSV